jgi:hypothetical protein
MVSGFAVRGSSGAVARALFLPCCPVNHHKAAMAASKPIDAKEMEKGRERDDIKKTYSTLLAAARGGGGKPRLDQTRSGEYVNLT